LLGNGDGSGMAVRAAGLCTCHEFAFRRALRWVDPQAYGRRSLLHDSIVVGLIVSTRHGSRRGRLRALRGYVVPARDPHGRYIVRPPHRPRKFVRGHWQTWRVGPTVWEEKSASIGATILLPATQGHFSDLLSERERAADGGVTAHDTWVCSENAGRVRNLARHEAGPCESHGKC